MSSLIYFHFLECWLLNSAFITTHRIISIKVLLFLKVFDTLTQRIRTSFSSVPTPDWMFFRRRQREIMNVELLKQFILFPTFLTLICRSISSSKQWLNNGILSIFVTFKSQLINFLIICCSMVNLYFLPFLWRCIEFLTQHYQKSIEKLKRVILFVPLK